MTRSYLVETAAEADRVVNRLAASGYPSAAIPAPAGFVVTVEAAQPSVTVEELLVRHAPSVRRL